MSHDDESLAMSHPGWPIWIILLTDNLLGLLRKEWISKWVSFYWGQFIEFFDYPKRLIFRIIEVFEESTPCLFNICLTIIRVSNFGTTVTEELISSSVTSIYWEQRDFKGPSLAKTHTLSYNSDIVGRDSGSTYFNSRYCLVAENRLSDHFGYIDVGAGYWRPNVLVTSLRCWWPIQDVGDRFHTLRKSPT